VKQPAGWAEEYAAAFEVESVADHYDLRPTYPDTTFDLLVDLLDRTVPKVLDAGCGPGDLARPLARRSVRVDAVDRSAATAFTGSTGA
jgi:2-polyprenyl-3-methyl-5-hydroxy-6-metoxy-1,4-benzoquinol methylase